MIWILLTAGIFALDCVCKKRMDADLKPGEERKILGGRILLRKLHNPGAMLGLGKQRRRLLAGASVFMTGAILADWIRLLGEKETGVRKLAVSLLLGGAASNVRDRLRQGYVVDYFSFNVPWKRLKKIVFNLSDLFIIGGSVLMAAWGIFHRD